MYFIFISLALKIVGLQRKASILNIGIPFKVANNGL
jgi:hypothetical protein